MSAYVVVCGHCPKGHVIVETYADAERQGWHWSKGQGWHCPPCWEKEQRHHTFAVHRSATA